MRVRFNIFASCGVGSLRNPFLRWMALLVFASAGFGAWAQAVPNWRSIGPPGGSLTALLADPLAPGRIWYAGSVANGVFASVDAGASWKASNSGMPAGRHIFAMATLGSYIYAATDAGVYVAPAGGVPAWALLQSPQPADPAPSCPINLLASANSKLYMAAGCDSRVYLTSAAGPSNPAWAATSLPLDSTGNAQNVSALGVFDGNIVAGSVSTVFRLDANQNWLSNEATTDVDGNVVPSGLAGEQIVALVSSSPRWAFACSLAGLVFQADMSVGALLTWTPLHFTTGTDPSTCNGLAVAKVGAATESVLAMLTGNGVFVSSVFDDSTASAPTMVPGPNFPMTRQVGVALQADPVGRSSLLWGTEFGLYASSTADLSQSTTLSTSTPTALNGPARLATPSQRLDNVNVQDVAQLGTSLFALAQSDSASYVDVLVSTDGGATWLRTSLTGSASPVGVIHSLVADSGHNVLYAATDQGIYYLWQGRGPWALLGSAYDVKALAVGAQTLYAGRNADGNGSVELRSLVGAAAFDPIQSTPIANFNVRAVQVSGGSVYVAGWVANGVGYDNAVYVTTDFVASSPVVPPAWRIYGNAAFASSSRVTGLAVASGVVFIGGSGFLVQSENGAWGTVNGFASIPAELVAVNALLADATTLYVGTSQGLWSIGLADRAVKGLAAMNGVGEAALPSLFVNGLRLIGGTVFVATGAGLAVQTAAAAPVSDAGTGGGCSMALVSEPDPLLWLLVGIAALQLLIARRRRAVALQAIPADAPGRAEGPL